MKQRLFILLLFVVFIAGRSNANESHSKMHFVDHKLLNNISVYCATDNTIDQFIIDEQEYNEFDGFSFFVDDPDIQMVRLGNKGLTIHPVILLTPKIKVITLISDLPPPQLS